jgi:hypothetical protein
MPQRGSAASDRECVEYRRSAPTDQHRESFRRRAVSR